MIKALVMRPVEVDKNLLISRDVGVKRGEQHQTIDQIIIFR